MKNSPFFVLIPVPGVMFGMVSNLGGLLYGKSHYVPMSRGRNTIGGRAVLPFS